MMPPWAFKAARDEAPIHAQILALNGLVERRNGRFRARVVRIFRDLDHAVHTGSLLEFRVPIASPCGLAVLGGPPSLYGEDVAASRFLEGFFERSGGSIRLVRSQIAPIRWPSWRPIYPTDFEGVVFRGNL